MQRGQTSDAQATITRRATPTAKQDKSVIQEKAIRGAQVIMWCAGSTDQQRLSNNLTHSLSMQMEQCMQLHANGAVHAEQQQQAATACTQAARSAANTVNSVEPS
jgi:glucan-binding YG repeat protein